LHSLPASEITHVVHAFATSLQMVFIWAVPVALVGFVLALVLQEVPLRGSERAGARDLGESFAMPQAQSSEKRLERAIASVLRHDAGRSLGEIIERSGSSLTEAELWALMGIFVRSRATGGPVSLTEIAAAHRLPAGVIAPVYHRLDDQSLIIADGDSLMLSAAGQEQMRRFIAALKEWLGEQLASSADPVESAEISAALDRIATRFVNDEASRRQELQSV
jgi:hypothetical protein